MKRNLFNKHLPSNTQQPDSTDSSNGNQQEGNSSSSSILYGSSTLGGLSDTNGVTLRLSRNIATVETHPVTPYILNTITLQHEPTPLNSLVVLVPVTYEVPFLTPYNGEIDPNNVTPTHVIVGTNYISSTLTLVFDASGLTYNVLGMSTATTNIVGNTLSLDLTTEPTGVSFSSMQNVVCMYNSPDLN